MKSFKKVLIGLFVAVAMGVAPVAAYAEVNPGVSDSSQVTDTVQSVPATPTPKDGKVPVTPVEGAGNGDSAICDKDEHARVQQCVAGQARSAISVNTPFRFNWSVLAVFVAADFAILIVTYNHESNRDKHNTYAQHYNGRFVAR